MVCTHEKMVVLATSPSVYVWFVVEGKFTCNTGHFASIRFAYVCVVLEVIYTCKSDDCFKETSCLYLCCCIGYVEI